MIDIMPGSAIRACIVTHKVKGKKVETKAIFHTWCMNAVIKDEAHGIIQTLALVEYADGSIAQVNPKNLRFTDGLFDEYFREDEDEKSSEEQLQVQQV